MTRDRALGWAVVATLIGYPAIRGPIAAEEARSPRGTAEEKVLAQGTAIVSIADFGARPDDDTSVDGAFAKALKAIQSTGGTILVPPGVYVLRDTLRIPAGSSNITIRGTGRSSVIKARFPGAVMVISKADHIGVESLRLTGAFSKGIFIEDSRSVRIEHCWVDGATDAQAGKAGALAGVALLNVSDVRIGECVFEENGSAGFDNAADILVIASGAAVRLDISDNDAHSRAVSANIALFNTSLSSVRGNLVEGAKVFGRGAAGGYGILVYHMPGFKTGSDVISGNRVTNTEGSGIYLQNAPNSTVSGNVVVRAALKQSDVQLQVGGIAVGREGPVTISGNVIDQSGSAGISAGGGGNTITGNVVTLPVGAGISLRDFQAGVVQGNTVEGGTFGVRTAPNPVPRGVIISGNILRDWSLAGIALEGGTESSILNNWMTSERGDTGVVLKGGAANAVRGNVIRIGAEKAKLCRAIRQVETTRNRVELHQDGLEGADTGCETSQE